MTVWEAYKNLTERASHKIEAVMSSDSCIEEKIDRFYKIHEKIKFRAFGKVDLKRKKTNDVREAVIYVLAEFVR